MSNILTARVSVKNTTSVEDLRKDNFKLSKSFG
jgi:hypothetical protein